MWKNELLQDIKALSGVPIYIAIILTTYLINIKELSIQLTIGLILAYAVTATIRLLHFVQRPDKQKYHNIIEKIDASSFPSLHAMRASTLATILALHFNNNILTTFFAITAIAIAKTRVLQKRHYPLDVIAGLILGVIVAYISIKLI